MKYILTTIMLISLAFGQVFTLIGMTGETIVEWCVAEEVSDPCPNQWTKDEFGRDKFYGCLVYHFHIEYDCNHSKVFPTYEEAKEFADRALKESNISEVKINGELIPKLVAEHIPIDVDSLFVGSTVMISPGNITTVAFEPISVDEKICWTANEIITLKNILDYAEECYNDSTPSYHHYINGGEVWHHKKPTFEGFIKWLKR